MSGEIFTMRGKVFIDLVQRLYVCKNYDKRIFIFFQILRFAQDDEFWLSAMFINNCRSPQPCIDRFRHHHINGMQCFAMTF